MPSTARPSPEGASHPCEAKDLSLTPGGWGGAAGTTYVVLHMDLVAGSACLVPGGPAVTLLDHDGAGLASAAATSDADVLVANRTDFRVGWASWCGAPPRGPLHLRLDLRSVR